MCNFHYIILNSKSQMKCFVSVLTYNSFSACFIIPWKNIVFFFLPIFYLLLYFASFLYLMFIFALERVKERKYREIHINIMFFCEQDTAQQSHHIIFCYFIFFFSLLFLCFIFSLLSK